MWDYKREDHSKIQENQVNEPYLNKEGFYNPGDMDSNQLSDEIRELVNLFTEEVKNATTSNQIIDLCKQYFRAIQWPVLIINQDFQLISSITSSESTESKEVSNTDLKKLFEKKDITVIKKKMCCGISCFGPVKSIHNKTRFYVYNFPFTTYVSNFSYNILILIPANHKTESPVFIDNLNTFENEFSPFYINEINKAFLDTLDGFYFIVNKTLHLVYISGKIHEKLKFAPEDLTGLPLNEILPVEANTECFNEIKNLFHPDSLLYKKLPLKKEVLLTDYYGEKSFYELTMALDNNNTSNESYLLCACIDIQDRKIKEKILEEEKEKAELKDLMKSEFLSNMSHDIRTPLNGIIGFSTMLDREDIDKAKREKYMKIIRSSSRQLLTLVNDIIDFTKIEAGELKMFFKPSNINQIIDELHFTYLQEIERLNKPDITLKKVIGNQQKQLLLNTDDMRLQQVLTNLLNNALKFTSAGEICFGYDFEEGNERKIRFFVKDTGIGIPKAQQDAIFSRYKQTKEGQKHKYNGTGLGLAISKGIVELLGSQLKVDSKANAGSEFYFTLDIE